MEFPTVKIKHFETFQGPVGTLIVGHNRVFFFSFLGDMMSACNVSLYLRSLTGHREALMYLGCWRYCL